MLAHIPIYHHTVSILLNCALELYNKLPLMSTDFIHFSFLLHDVFHYLLHHEPLLCIPSDSSPSLMLSKTRKKNRASALLYGRRKLCFQVQQKPFFSESIQSPHGLSSCFQAFSCKRNLFETRAVRTRARFSLHVSIYVSADFKILFRDSVEYSNSQ